MNGIKVPGFFSPGTVNGYVTEARWIRGTYVVVNTLVEANQIPLTVRIDGTVVYVNETRTEYRWEAGNWEVLHREFEDAPKDGEVYARCNGAWVVVNISEIEGGIKQLSQDIAKLRTDVESTLAEKQDTLVSGTNIKTINGQDLLGSGNIEISGGTGKVVPATPDTLGGFYATDLSSIKGVDSYVGMDSSNRAFVKIPNVSETSTSADVVNALNNNPEGYLILDGNN